MKSKAGPLGLARDILGADKDPFFVLNSDVICEFPFQHLLEFHKSHGCEGTLMTTPVDDPSKFGVIVSVPGSTRIERFVEKPKEYVGNHINAGIYIFNPSILDRIEVIYLKTRVKYESYMDPVKKEQTYFN